MAVSDPYPIPSSELDRQVPAFLLALTKQWRKVVSFVVGEGVLILFIGLSGVTIPPLIYGLLAVIAITFGTFFAWRDQLKEAEKANAVIQELRVKLDEKSAPRMEITFPPLGLEEVSHSKPNLEAKVKNVSSSSIDGLGMIIENISPPAQKSILHQNSDVTFPWPLKTSEKAYRLNPDETFPVPIGAASFSAPSYAPNGEKYCILRMANADGTLSNFYASFESGKDYTMEVKATAHDYKGPSLKYTVRVEQHSREETEWYLLKITGS